MYHAISSTHWYRPKNPHTTPTHTRACSCTHTLIHTERVTNLPDFPGLKNFLGHGLSGLKHGRLQENQHELVSLHTGTHPDTLGYHAHTQKCSATHEARPLRTLPGVAGFGVGDREKRVLSPLPSMFQGCPEFTYLVHPLCPPPDLP